MPETLHPQWQQWVLENLAAGATRGEVEEQLVAEGIDASLAATAVATLHQSPTFAVVRRLFLRGEALELMLRLRRDHRAHAERPIERIPMPSAADFERTYLQPGEPVILTDLVTRSRAYGRWSHAYFAESHADVQVEVCMRRQSHRRPDADWRDLTETMSMREVIAHLATPSVGNDVYMIGKNGALRRPELRAELDDVDLPAAYFGTTPSHRDTGLWIGAAGTHTPLHHDGNSAILMQFFGSKRFRMIPPESTALLDVSDGVYSQWDPPEEPEAEPLARYREFVLEAGEALLIPAGWWHQVRALEPSISLTLTELAPGMDCSWYRPGTRLRGRPSPTRGGTPKPAPAAKR
ncbi:MAG: cupin-like domain-containing protein [Myxococcota bacterium]